MSSGSPSPSVPQAAERARRTQTGDLYGYLDASPSDQITLGDETPHTLSLVAAWDPAFIDIFAQRARAGWKEFTWKKWHKYSPGSRCGYSLFLLNILQQSFAAEELMIYSLTMTEQEILRQEWEMADTFGLAAHMRGPFLPPYTVGAQWRHRVERSRVFVDCGEFQEDGAKRPHRFSIGYGSAIMALWMAWGFYRLNHMVCSRINRPLPWILHTDMLALDNPRRLDRTNLFTALLSTSDYSPKQVSVTSQGIPPAGEQLADNFAGLVNLSLGDSEQARKVSTELEKIRQQPHMNLQWERGLNVKQSTPTVYGRGAA